MAEELAAKGKNLLLVARSENLLEEVSADFKKRYGIAVQHLTLDLSDTGAAEKIKKWVVDNAFPIDILINNAGYGLWGRFDQLTLAEQQNMMQLNVTSLVELTYFILPILKKEKKIFYPECVKYHCIPVSTLHESVRCLKSFCPVLYKRAAVRIKKIQCFGKLPESGFYINQFY